LLVATTGAQRASRDPNRASNRGRGRHVRLALVSATLLASLLAAIGAAPAAASTSKPYYSVELYYLSLVNCTRTGGWVQRDGTCIGYGSGQYSVYVPPLRLSAGISDRASRPYARLLAIRNLCSHYADHDPGYRLRRAGYRSWVWGENIGCGNGYTSAKAAVLDSHLRMQAEMSTNGGHWRNIKATKFRWVGIGVWRYAGRTRVVTDFYI